jgi:cytochrome d ubiquinol oxidase subunit II
MVLDYIDVILLWLSIIVYASLGGADFGGGIWYFFTFGKGKKADEERKAISGAIGPVWEANNVWLVYLIVGLFTAFPIVAATLATALFIPFSLILIGVVLRGASFAFEAHILSSTGIREAWGRGFSASSVFAPFFLGASAAAVASGDIHVNGGNIPIALFTPWLTPFAIIVGLMAISVSASIAAVYLTVEAQATKNKELEDAYRSRAFIAGGITSLLGIVAIALSPSEASYLWNGMLNHGLWAVAITILLGLATAAALFYRRFRSARILVVMSVGGLLGSWGVSQIPYIIPPNLTVTGAASPPSTMLAFLISAIIGMSVLIPSMWLLFHVFKGKNPTPKVHDKALEES